MRSSETVMKKAKTKQARARSARADEVLREYDFSRSRPNKFASRFQAGSAVVVLDPDIAAVFPSATGVNEALRALAGVIRRSRSRRVPTPRNVKAS
jgi:hypothetical protein